MCTNSISQKQVAWLFGRVIHACSPEHFLMRCLKSHDAFRRAWQPLYDVHLLAIKMIAHVAAKAMRYAQTLHRSYALHEKKSAILKMRTAEIGDMQLGIIGRVSKWCIPTFLEGIASHRKYRILLTFSRFRVQVPRNLRSEEPQPLNNSHMNQGYALDS